MAKKDVTKPISLDPRGGRPREKCVTYIEGIDRILNGGLPIGNIVLDDRYGKLALLRLRDAFGLGNRNLRFSHRLG